MKKVILVIVLICLTTSGVLAAETESKLMPVPILGSSPETGFMLGGMAIYLQEKGQEKLKINSGGMYTQKGQTNIFLQTNKDYQDKEVNLGISYQDWVSKFYGIGNKTSSESEEKYDSKRIQIGGGISQEIIENNFLGIVASYEDHNLQLDKNIEGIKGTEGMSLLGLGFKYSYDTRDRSMDTTSGQYFNYKATAYNNNLTDYQCFKNDIDYRIFKNLSTEHTIGLQAKLEISSGQVPLQKLASLGNSNIMRGILTDRYIDKNKFAAQIEYRYPIWKQVSGIAFVSTGEVYTDSFELDKLKQSYGLGIRYNLDEEEGINLRFDLAFNQDESMTYINFGEAF